MNNQDKYISAETEQPDIWSQVYELEASETPVLKQAGQLLRKLYLENFTLREIAVNLHWMARRYADGRMTYAPGMVNNAVRQLQAMGVKLNICGECTPWARDGMGPGYSGISREEYEMGEPLDGWNSAANTEEVKALAAENERLKDEIAYIQECMVERADGLYEWRGIGAIGESDNV